jgi:hypothetical protein
MVNGINAQGKCGLNISFISYSGWLRSSVVADTAIMDNPNPLLDLMEGVIKEMLKKADSIE